MEEKAKSATKFEIRVGTHTSRHTHTSLLMEKVRSLVPNEVRIRLKLSFLSHPLTGGVITDKPFHLWAPRFPHPLISTLTLLVCFEDYMR